MSLVGVCGEVSSKLSLGSRYNMFQVRIERMPFSPALIELDLYFII